MTRVSKDCSGGHNFWFNRLEPNTIIHYIKKNMISKRHYTLQKPCFRRTQVPPVPGAQLALRVRRVFFAKLLELERLNKKVSMSRILWVNTLRYQPHR